MSYLQNTQRTCTTPASLTVVKPLHNMPSRMVDAFAAT